MKSSMEIQNKLMRIWQDIFKDKEIEADSNFFEFGGTSLKLTQMLLSVNKQLNVNISLPKFFALPTIGDLSNEIQKELSHSGSSSFSLHDALYEAQCEAELNYALQDSQLECCFQKHPENGKNVLEGNFIFLTGATGFLGAHLLEQLIDQTTATIYCLVREETAPSAKEKLSNALQCFNLSYLMNDRVVPVCGDLAKPDFGIPNDRFSSLCETVDTIFHCGANVHHIYNYDQLRNENTLSTAECIRMASIKRHKEIHYISTISCVSRFDDDGIGYESEPAEIPPSSFGGYVLAKWASERLLWQASQKGLTVRIYRPGNITGHSETGVCVPDFNHALLFAKGCLQMGAAPYLRMKLEMTPVDILSKSIIALSTREKPGGTVYNLLNPHEISWRKYFQHLSRKGVSVKMLPYKEWRETCLLNTDEDNALFPLITLYGEDEIYYPSCHSNKAQETLLSLSIHYPKNYGALIDIYYDYLKETGFLN